MNHPYGPKDDVDEGAYMDDEKEKHGNTHIYKNNSGTDGTGNAGSDRSK